VQQQVFGDMISTCNNSRFLMQVEITADVDALREHFCGADGSFEMLVGHDWGTPPKTTYLPY
jgi:hypothetical protein